MPKPTTRREAKAEAAWLAAFGSPHRLAILRALAAGEKTVKSLSVACGMHHANTSNHLNRLKAVGLLVGERYGGSKWYKLVGGTVTARGLELVHALGVLVVIPL